MKIQEFREKIKQCSKEDAEKIAAELYKLLPKSKKEEIADQLIEDILSGKDKKEKQKANEVLDFDSLKKEINTFLENADNDYYYVPNRVVPKNKRSKWRFEVKRYIKAINDIPADCENGEESAKLLRELYKRLSHGCGYYIFPTEDPFRSVGIGQPELYDMLIKRTFATGYTDEKIKNMLEDATLVCLDRYSLHIDMENIFAVSLATSDLKYKAIEFIKEYVAQYEAKLKVINKYSNDRYSVRSAIKELCNTLLIVSLLLYEPEDAVEYYWQHMPEKDKEITLYCLLNIIRIYSDKKLWISVYEDALQKGIEPRDTLREYYLKLKNADKK